MPNDTNPDYEPYTTPDSLNDLYDVKLTNPVAPCVLYFHNGAWENFPPAAAITSPVSDSSGTKAAIDAIIAALVAAGIVTA